MNAKRQIDFNHRSPGYAKNWREMALDFHGQHAPIAWTDAYEGFWVVGSHSACIEILSDWETFTSFNDLEGTGNGGRGQIIPQMPYRLELGESDPPLHSQRRNLEAPFFTPKLIRRWAALAQQHVDEQIDNVLEAGRADIVRDVIMPTAARTTLKIVGYEGSWEEAGDAAHKMSFIPPNHPDYPAEALKRMRANFREQFVARRSEPREDVISALGKGAVDGRGLTEAEGESMLNALVLGGFDTTTSIVANALTWLLEHPDDLARFRDDPTIRRNAIEELLRYFPPTSGMTRTATRDTVVLGQPIAKGERLYCWFAAANNDPAVFENSQVVDFERKNASQHISFSSGSHRCLGAPLAKAEAEIMLETIIRRLIGLQIVDKEVVRYASVGSILGFADFPVTFEARHPSSENSGADSVQSEV
ncbi:cytochrome P450 [Pseudomonas sp. JAI111]|uniref:cytochrome P450 n=1 Tax=Pseudomonas sp. JAI111 TaxID=2735913 RepID=UPI002166C24E|nr:cytochrome P450 [Pseudomonas sp. JAI111]MCS3835671.1 cytochrome P450 [Pseudomonas sp. JAI111]